MAVFLNVDTQETHRQFPQCPFLESVCIMHGHVRAQSGVSVGKRTVVHVTLHDVKYVHA